MKKITLGKNLYSGILAVLISVFLRVMLPYSIKSKMNTVTSAVGSAYLPRLVIYDVTLCGVCLLLTGLASKKDETLEVEIGWEGHAVLYFILFLFYMFIMKYVGFLIASVISSTVSMWMTGDGDWKHYLSVELLVIVIFVSFKYGLHVTPLTVTL